MRCLKNESNKTCTRLVCRNLNFFIGKKETQVKGEIYFLSVFTIINMSSISKLTDSMQFQSHLQLVWNSTSLGMRKKNTLRYLLY